MSADLRAPAHAAVLPRLRDIEARLRACMARGEQPAPSMLADALQGAAGALLLIVEAEERIEAAEAAAGRRETRYLAAEERLSALVARLEAFDARWGWLSRFF